MFKSKLSLIALSLMLAGTASVTACKKDGGGPRKGKSERLRWVDKPTVGTAKENGKVLEMPGVGITFHVPDVLYVFRKCEEPGHAGEGPDNDWIPVVRCSVTDGPVNSDSESDEEPEEDWDSEEESDDGGVIGAGTTDMTIYIADKSDMIINERSVESFRLEYQNAGYKVVEIGYHDEYMSKPGRRGIEIIAQTINSESGYPDRVIHRFMFPKDDILFIAHVDYAYGADQSGIDSDWQRILWGFQLNEDGPLYGAQ